MKILAVLKQNKILGNIYFSEKIFYRKQSFGAPVFLRYSRTKKTPFKAIKKEGSKSLKIDIFPLNRRTRVKSIFERRQRRTDFPQQIASLHFQTTQKKARLLHASSSTFRSKIHPKGPLLALEEN